MSCQGDHGVTSSSTRQRILIVEDDVELRRFFRTVLSFEGFEVQEAGDGLDALHRLDESPPDLVILDLMLPTMSGLVIRQEIAAQAHTRNIPIVVVTGSALPLDDLELPCVLRKPISPDALIGAIRKCLAAGAGGV